MANYKLTVKAVDDLTDIWSYTVDSWSEEQADKYYNLLVDAFDDVATKPFLGKDYSEITEKLRGLGIGKHIIFYRETKENEIEIIRILHEQMDLENRIKEK
jgi:toxin ParE1/3/4